MSEAADWQVLTLRLAVQLQALKNSIPDDESLDGNSSKYKQVISSRMFQARPIAVPPNLGVVLVNLGVVLVLD